MKTRDFPSREAAIKAARERDKHYWPEFRRDGLIILSNGKKKYAILPEPRARSTVYHLVTEFPPDKTGDA